VAAAGLAGLTAARGARTALSLGRILPLFLAVFLAMLLVRQHHQNRSLSGFEKRAGAEGRIRAARLVPFKPAALARYADDLKTSYDNGRTIYERSCAFCHSADGDGRGPDAGSLTVPPEDIASIRSTRPYLLHVLVSGIPGTGMPYFSVFLPDKLEGLIRHLDERWGVLGRPPVVPGVGSAEIEEAEKTYSERCAGCHGQDGIPTRPARAFQPPPPSFAQFSPLPARALEIIKEGYPGTMMTPFGPDLAARLGPALVQVIYGKRRI
jgi:mono/diheme cytochrome c family protein